MASLNRRAFLGSALSGALAASAGCSNTRRIFEDENVMERIETATQPEITARDVAPEGATTTFEIRWRAVAATKIDVNRDDGDWATPIQLRGKYLVVSHETTNVGDRPHWFDPESYRLDTDDRGAFVVSYLNHLTDISPRDLRPNSRTTGWVPIWVPSDLEAGELFVDQRRFDDPLAVDWQHDPTLPINF